MIRIITDAGYDVDVDLWYGELIDLARIDLKNYVKKSSLSRIEAISARLKDGARAANEMDEIPKTYVIGHCVATKVHDHVFMIDYTNIDLDKRNDIELVLV